MSFEKHVGYSGFAVVVGLAAWFLFPFVAIVGIPCFLIYWAYTAWSDNPSRLEREAKKRTWQLYEDAKARFDNPLEIEQAFAALNGEVPEEQQQTYQHLKRVFLRLWRFEGYATELKPPPLLCNSIEGGKYRDYLNNLSYNQDSLMRVSAFTNLMLANTSMTQDLARILGTLIVNNADGDCLYPKTAAIIKSNYAETKDYVLALKGTVIEELMNFTQSLSYLPDELRTHHHHIVAGSGSGKTQCLQQMILKDLEEDASIVVIDSQGDFINNLATRIDPDRLILIDPEHCPPALNLFQSRTGEKEIATAIEFYEYIFASLDSEMTSKQQTAYRFVSRLLMTIPDANIHTMREILEPKGLSKYPDHFDELGETAKSFFRNEFTSKQFTETRQQILRRLYTVLENKTLESMLAATESRLNINEALDNNKVILISTAKGYLKQTGASLLGRIFIAQVMQAVMARGENRKRVHLYIDEFQDYAEDSHVLFNLFEQARKYNLGLIIAHQYLGQLPTQLQQSISANTAIKFARGVSADDARVLAKQMNVTPEFIQNQSVGDFASYLKDMGTTSYHVEFGKLERMPEINKISDIHENMRKRYGVKEVIKTPPVTPPPEPETPELEPEEETDDLDRSKW